MPELVNTGPSEFGWHKYDDMKCPRFFALSHGAGLSTIPASALIRGSMAHVALGQHYARLRAQQCDADPDKYYHVREGLVAYGESLDTDEGRSTFTKYFGETMSMHAQYLAQFGTDPTWEILGVEKEERARVSDGAEQYLYTQGIDLVARINGKVYFIDHKTMARRTPRVIERYEVNGQFIGYQWLGKLRYGHEFGGVMINALQKPRKDGRWEFKRVHVRPAPGLVRDFKTFIILSQRRLARLREEFGENWDTWPSSPHSGNCYHAYGPCPFLDRCRRGDHGGVVC